jgi:Holliday junction resolvasome RuvABC endonuclease subunit
MASDIDLGELSGILKWKLWERGINVEIVPPTTLKKWATGKGNADKKLIYDTFQKETGVNLWKIMTPDKKDVESPLSDVCDSYFMCKWGWNEKMINKK